MDYRLSSNSSDKRSDTRLYSNTVLVSTLYLKHFKFGSEFRDSRTKYSGIMLNKQSLALE